jgi:hypothetical protein
MPVHLKLAQKKKNHEGKVDKAAGLLRWCESRGGDVDTNSSYFGESLILSGRKCLVPTPMEHTFTGDANR